MWSPRELRFAVYGCAEWFTQWVAILERDPEVGGRWKTPTQPRIHIKMGGGPFRVDEGRPGWTKTRDT
jgi:hypothetical protein